MDLAAQLESIYAEFTRRELVSPDPLEVLYAYPSLRDREIVGLLASCLAYGQVKSIVGSLQRFLPRLGPSPAAFLRDAKAADLLQAAAGIQHRWTASRHLASLLKAMQGMLRDLGSLEAAWLHALDPAEETVEVALARWVARLRAAAQGEDIDHLLPDPERGSTCKRLHLYLRWMTRCDAVDPGGWTAVRPDQLLVPVDVHMYRIGLALRFTRRRQADARATREITAGFRQVCPADPVRYDFALTRLGIRERWTRQGTIHLRRRLLEPRSADGLAQRIESGRGG